MTTLLPMAGRPGDSETPPFERVAIAGYGLLGGSLGLAVKERWPRALVIAIDSKDVIETAMRMHAADVGGDDLVLAAEADLVVLAAPVHANHNLLASLPDVIPGEALVTDVGSTKRRTVAAAAALPARLPFVGGHPLAGGTARGLEAARPDLFRGRPWILTPGDPVGEPIARLRAMLGALGAQVRILTPEAHDELLAHLSHLPQLVVSALMQVVGDRVGASGLALAGRGLRDTTRLAASPPGIWRDILATNGDHIDAAIEELIAALRRLQHDASGEAVTATFEAAAAWKRTLDTPAGEPS